MQVYGTYEIVSGGGTATGYAEKTANGDVIMTSGPDIGKVVR